MRPPQRDEINRSIIRGDSERGIAKRFGVSSAAVHRHKRNHLAPSLIETHNAEVTARNDGLLGQMREIQERTLSLLAAAEQNNDVKGALAAIREARANMEMSARLLSAAAASTSPPQIDQEEEDADLSALNDRELDLFGYLIAKAQRQEWKGDRGWDRTGQRIRDLLASDLAPRDDPKAWTRE